MSKYNGGYKIISLKSPTIYEDIESNLFKPLLLTDIVIDKKEMNDVFSFVTIQGTDFVFINIYNKNVRVTDENVVTYENAIFYVDGHVSDNVVFGGRILKPIQDNYANIGTSSKRIKTLYANKIQCNEGSSIDFDYRDEPGATKLVLNGANGIRLNPGDDEVYVDHCSEFGVYTDGSITLVGNPINVGTSRGDTFNLLNYMYDIKNSSDEISVSSNSSTIWVNHLFDEYGDAYIKYIVVSYIYQGVFRSHTISNFYYGHELNLDNNIRIDIGINFFTSDDQTLTIYNDTNEDLIVNIMVYTLLTKY